MRIASNGERRPLNDDEARLAMRLRTGLVPDASIDPYAVCSLIFIFSFTYLVSLIRVLLNIYMSYSIFLR